jgi:hypothetical protein
MASSLEDRVRELEQLVREILNRPQRNVFGSRDTPLAKVYLRDGKTGSVAEVDYDAANATLRTTKVR